MSTIVSKRSWILVTIIFSFILCFPGCGKDKSPTESQETYLFTITTGSSSSEVNLDEFPKYMIEEENAVKLSELVDTTVLTEPHNFAYRLIGSDGFYAHIKGNPDNTWDHMQNGYIILSTMAVSFDPSLGIINRYNIKDVAELKILRKIDFVTPADSLIQFIVDELLRVSFQDSLNAVALSELIPRDVVSSPSLLVYELVAVDDYSVTLTYQQVQEGFYVIEQDRVLYSNPEIQGAMKVKMLNRLIARYPKD